MLHLHYRRDTVILLRVAYTAIGFVALAMLAILFAGVPLVGHDSYFHLNNLAQFRAAQESGISLPRWAPNAYYGLGSPLFYFYPPLLNVTASVLLPFAASYPWAMRLTMVAIFILMILSCADYLSALHAGSSRKWIAAVAYSASPYAFFDIFVRGCYSEYYAMAFIPLILSGIERAMNPSGHQSARFASIWRITCGSALLLLTSIPISALCAIVLPLYLLVRMRGNPWQYLIPLTLGLLLAGLCAGFYLLPAMQFHNAVHLAHVVSFESNRHFQEFTLNLLVSGKHPTDDLVDFVLLLLTLALLIAWIAEWRSYRNAVALSWIVLLSVVILLHIPILAGPLADSFPAISLVQFPYRAYVLTSLSLGCYLGIMQRTFELRRAIYLVILSALCTVIFATIFLVFHSVRSGREFPIEPHQRSSAFEYTPREALGTPSSVLQFAREHENDPDILPIEVARKSDTLHLTQSDAALSHYHIALRETTHVRFHRFYWPLWQLVTDDGVQIPISSDEHGVLCAMLPAGRYDLHLSLARSWAERTGATVSFVGFACFLLVMLCSARRQITSYVRHFVAKKNPTLIQRRVWGSKIRNAVRANML
jgi:hypothetical protein